jgi:uncharacterized membrane protein HdeD (DUF308 family)
MARVAKPAAKTSVKKTTEKASKPATKTVKKPATKTVKTAAKSTVKTAVKSPAKVATKSAAKTATKPSVKIMSAPVSSRDWSWLLGLGILFVIFGFLGLSSVVGVTLISIVFIGFMFLMGGVLQFVDVTRSRRWEAAVWHALIALMYLIGGCFIIWDPVLASTVITALIGWTLVIIGIIRLIMALSLHGTKGWGFSLIASLTAIILGGMILMQWPVSSLWVIGLFISIELLLNGLSYVIMAIAMRNQYR